MFRGLTKIWAVLGVGVLVMLTTVTAWAFEADTVTFNVRVENIGGFKFHSSGVFNTPVGASEAGPLVPGGVYEFGFNAVPGDRLSFASMFVQSNDWFIAPDQAGLALFNSDGTPITGNVTGQIHLWDSGAEINQEPGLGVDQPLQGAGPNTGPADPDNTVRLVSGEFDNVPAVSIEAAPGDYLSFATMFVQSNDLFYGVDGKGIALFGADGAPIKGDVTDQVLLWDAGTEVNQAPRFGAD